ncbi:hypothetical protein Vretimale_287 [Volvox reticuliferus]|uniref:Uncharacterized protein n=1 Tax=Volvox reticuliferus TaxID=1737510 RepID=A0A8J4FYB2_9CHLO|nr:hypothetical protein Vretifemale_2618 [Volvox reticuliferus]GIL94116.1 hypothetical protein Vretimale_287 [Volvox reticuliferus]
MSWLICCIRSKTLGKSSAPDERPTANEAAKPASPSKATTGNSLSVRVESSFGQEEDPSMPRPLLHAPSSRVRKSSQYGLRLSEDTFVSALSTTPTTLNPLAYVFPFVSDDNEGSSTGQTREEVDALGNAALPQPRSKVEFADLCGSLEDLVYLGEGSNGIVYSASWHGARVAVKFLLGNHDDSTHLQRCLTEAVLTRVLSHPCVVQCFVTAIAQLTPELWAAIRARCHRHQSVLQSSSFGRFVAAAVIQQEQQERAGIELGEQQQQQPQLSYDRRQGATQVQSQSFLNRSRQSPRNTPSQQQQQQTPLQVLAPSRSVSQSQAQLLLLQSQDRGSACPSGPACESSSEQAMLELHKVGAIFGEDVDPHLRPQQQQQQQQAQLSPRPQLGRSPQRPQQQHSEVIGSQELMSGEGVGTRGGEGTSLIQALVDLKAEVGQHCTVVVMEYMDAGTLHQAIMRGDFSARRSLEYRSKLLALLLTAQELAQGMAHLHGLDILHGDLKPTNVLLKGSPCQFVPTSQQGQRGEGGAGAFMCTDPRGYTAKIADMGLARPCSEETAELSSDEWGALAYLAPEAAKGSCCKASDVYSFGVMLWEMSAGVRPYLGLTTPQVLMGLVTGTLQLTWPSDGSLYAPLRSLAIACTDFNPTERPTSEVAARILGRMVRHIRSAAEPLRQRHSSALSVEAATAAAAAAAAAAAGGSEQSNGGGGRGSAKCVLNNASRSMPIYLPTTVVASATTITTPTGFQLQPSGDGSYLPRMSTLAPPPPVSAALLAAASRSCGGDVAVAPGRGGPISPPLQRLPGGYDMWRACSSGVTTDSGSCSGSGPPPAAATNVGPSRSTSGVVAPATCTTATSPAAAGSIWCAAAAQSAAYPHPCPFPYPRARRPAGGGACGDAMVKSPLGAAAAAAATSNLVGFQQRPSAPCDLQGAELRSRAPAAERAACDRPESSPVHSQFLGARLLRGSQNPKVAA